MLDKSLQGLLEKRSKVLGHAYRLFYDEPIHTVKGSGVWLTDANGLEYLDAYNNVPCVGHCHPHVTEALCQQASTLNTHTRYVDEIILDYAQRLISYFPEQLDQVIFTCTGSEANDLAMRVAQVNTGGTGFVVTQNAYHGVTMAVSQISPSLGAYASLPANVKVVEPPINNDTESVSLFIQNIDKAFVELENTGFKPAAFMVDTVLSSDGIITDPAGFLQQVIEVVHQHKALFIADEVQAGFGRTGSGMWGFQRHNIVPDLVSLGKPMGNGHPMAGLVSKSQYFDVFGSKSRYFNTFGGNPVSSAVGSAVLDVFEKENILDNCLAVGNYLIEKLRSIPDTSNVVKDVRGAGLFIGVEVNGLHNLDSHSVGNEIVNSLKEKRVLVSLTGPQKNILKIRPPLVFNRQNADFFLDKFVQVIDEI